MGTFGAILWIFFRYMGLFIQTNAAVLDGHEHLDHRVSVNALFTEVPRDVITQSGEDVEMACSFRGEGSPSYSLEIQWWYIKDCRDGQEAPATITNEVVPLEEATDGATKISVVKVFGSNISHKLCLSSVKTSDSGIYECRVIDFSATEGQHHRVRAVLQVAPEQHPGAVGESGQLLAESALKPQSHHDQKTEDTQQQKRMTDTHCDGCLL